MIFMYGPYTAQTDRFPEGRHSFTTALPSSVVAAPDLFAVGGTNEFKFVRLSLSCMWYNILQLLTTLFMQFMHRLHDAYVHSLLLYL